MEQAELVCTLQSYKSPGLLQLLGVPPLVAPPHLAHKLHNDLLHGCIKFHSATPHLMMTTSNSQLWESCYWDNDLFPGGSQNSPPSPPHKIVGIRSKSGTSWGTNCSVCSQFKCNSDQSCPLLKGACRRRWTGWDQSDMHQNTKGLPTKGGSTPGIQRSMELCLDPAAGRAGRRHQQACGSQPRTPDPRGRSHPFTRLKHWWLGKVTASLPSTPIHAFKKISFS